MLNSVFRGAASVSLLLHYTVPAIAQCYWPNGTQKISPDVAKCPGSDTCCYLNRANNPGNDTQFGIPRDECLPNGLCQQRGTADTESPPRVFLEYWRDFCADPTWKNCPQVCTDLDAVSKITRMTPCDGTSTSLTWCCGNDRNCCGTGNEIRIAQVNASNSSPITTSSTSAPSSSALTEPGQMSPPTSHNSSARGGLTTGAKAGIGVGVSGGIAVISAAIFFLLRRKRSRGRSSEAASEYGDMQNFSTSCPELMSAARAEIMSIDRTELAARDLSAELMSQEVGAQHMAGRTRPHHGMH